MNRTWNLKASRAEAAIRAGLARATAGQHGSGARIVRLVVRTDRGTGERQLSEAVERELRAALVRRGAHG